MTTQKGAKIWIARWRLRTRTGSSRSSLSLGPPRRRNISPIKLNSQLFWNNSLFLPYKSISALSLSLCTIHKLLMEAVIIDVRRPRSLRLGIVIVSAEAAANGSMKIFHLSVWLSLPILPEGVSYGLPGFTVSVSDFTSGYPISKHQLSFSLSIGLK